jgi:hypothetical protein
MLILLVVKILQRSLDIRVILNACQRCQCCAQTRTVVNMPKAKLLVRIASFDVKRKHSQPSQGNNLTSISGIIS